MPNNEILIEHPRPGLAILTLNRPASLNALTMAMRKQIVDTIHSLDKSGDVHVIIITGAGRAFCAGLDLGELSRDSTALDSVADIDPAGAIAGFGGVVIGAINGPAITGGFEVALSCDTLIASEEARFADSHVHVGVLSGWGLSQRLSRVVGIHRAKLLSLTGKTVDAGEALRLGLVADVLPQDDLMPEARRIADAMLQADPLVLRSCKQIIDEGFGLCFSAAMRLESSVSSEFNKNISAEDIESRRRAVQSRGRRQTKDADEHGAK